VYLVVFYKKIHTFNRTAAFRYSLYIPCILMLIGFAKWNVIKTDSPINLMNDRYMSETYVVKKFGIFTFNILNLLKIRDTNKLIRVLDQGDVIKGEGDSTKTPANILVIQIESMDAFSVNAKYRNNHVMPYLNSLSKKCVYYPFTLSYHKAGSTSDCEFSCINTTEPLDRFPSIKIRNYNFPNSVIKRFTKNKYDVEIFHGNRGDYFNRKIAFRKMGFPEFYDMNDMKLKEVVWGAPDENVLNFMTGKLKTAKQPFFFYIITMSSHEPFTFIEPYFRTKKFDGIKDARSKNYLTCLAYVDGVLKKFIGMIQSQYPDTYIIIFGDHTPGIFKGYYRQASLRFNDIYFEFVPLFIITPDNRVHYEKKRAVSFLDIAPTILAASNRPYEIKSFGMDLLADTAEWKPVPFRGQLYKREFLYKMISQELKRKPKKK